MRTLRWADPPADSELRLVDAAKATSFALLLLGGTISIALCIAMLIVLAVGALVVAVRCCPAQLAVELSDRPGHRCHFDRWMIAERTSPPSVRSAQP
jgi:hypothetical protein